jgi:hypothetical protein
VAPLPQLTSGLVAHGGVGGAAVEVLIVLTVAAVFVAIWLRERRSRSQDDEPG